MSLKKYLNNACLEAAFVVKVMEATDHSALPKIRVFSHVKAQREIKEPDF